MGAIVNERLSCFFMAKKKADLPLDPKTELFHWGPIPGRLFYPSDFVAPMFHELMDAYGECWPPSLFLFHGGRMCWINEFPVFRETGRAVFKKYVLPKKRREGLRALWRKKAAELFAYEKKIHAADLTKLSDDLFRKVWNGFYTRKSAFWLPSILPELGNYGSPEYLEEKLHVHGVSKDATKRALEVLTAPEAPSFYLEEELALARAKDVAQHAERFFWLKNSYNGSMVLPVSFFAERKKTLPKDLHRLEAKRQKEVRAQKERVKGELKLTREIMDVAEAITFAVEWQDERKADIFRSIHTKTALLSETARRHGRSFDELLNWPSFEVSKLVAGEKAFAWSSAGQEFYGIYQNERHSRVLGEAEAKQYWDLYVQGSIGSEVTEFSGIIASVGTGKTVQGKVRVLLDPHDLDSFHDGEILVTSMTSPEYVFAMKKARAIITDTGGLTSHAAVTSRELGKPCIVGTKIATKVLRDGDMVAIDISRGVVKKL